MSPQRLIEVLSQHVETPFDVQVEVAYIHERVGDEVIEPIIGLRIETDDKGNTTRLVLLTPPYQTTEGI